ncbi:MAG: cytochrome P450, partial [Actinomycetota bacterium]|nr:cytochrome P450 [Actinomycetota bacterium]
VHVTGRIATTDVVLAGHTIRKGEEVAMVLGAVHRDPAQFPDPDRLDVGRTPNRHLAFAAGPHYCLGAALARLEAQVAFSSILRRLPEMELVTTEPVYRAHFVIRGITELRVGFPPQRTAA